MKTKRDGGEGGGGEERGEALGLGGGGGGGSKKHLGEEGSSRFGRSCEGGGKHVGERRPASFFFRRPFVWGRRKNSVGREDERSRLELHLRRDSFSDADIYQEKVQSGGDEDEGKAGGDASRILRKRSTEVARRLRRLSLTQDKWTASSSSSWVSLSPQSEEPSGRVAGVSGGARKPRTQSKI